MGINRTTSSFLFRLSPLGTLTLAKWCESMESATHLGLPWRLLRERLAPPDPDFVATTVHYNKTLELLDSDFMVSGLWCDVMDPCNYSFLLLPTTTHSSRNRIPARHPWRTHCIATRAAWRRSSASWTRTIPDKSLWRSSVRRVTCCTNTYPSTARRRNCWRCAS